MQVAPGNCGLNRFNLIKDSKNHCTFSGLAYGPRQANERKLLKESGVQSDRRRTYIFCRHSHFTSMRSGKGKCVHIRGEIHDDAICGVCALIVRKKRANVWG